MFETEGLVSQLSNYYTCLSAKVSPTFMLASEREREADRKTDRQRQTDTGGQTDRDRDRHRQRDTERGRDREKKYLIHKPIKCLNSAFNRFSVNATLDLNYGKKRRKKANQMDCFSLYLP